MRTDFDAHSEMNSCVEPPNNSHNGFITCEKPSTDSKGQFRNITYMTRQYPLLMFNNQE